MRSSGHLRPPGSIQAGLPGLYAQQHRGQESAGICTYGGGEIHGHKAMGHVADIFTKPVLASLPGELAIGHTRYSTAGDTVLLNAQPFSVVCNKGRVAVAHNGNITNAGPNCAPNWGRRARFSRRRAIPR
jgi:glutamine phosphoribosylpyrophosphate amidotransferase